MGNKHINPLFAPVFLIIFRCSFAEFLASLGLFLDIDIFQLVFGLYLNHVDGVRGLDDKIRHITLRIVLPVNLK